MTRSRRKKQAAQYISPQTRNALSVLRQGYLPPGSEQLRAELEDIRNAAVEAATGGQPDKLDLLTALAIDSSIKWHCASQLAMLWLSESHDAIAPEKRLDFIERSAKSADRRNDALTKAEKVRKLLAGEPTDVSASMQVVLDFYAEDMAEEQAAADAFKAAGVVDELQALASEPYYQGKSPAEIIDSCIPPIGEYPPPPAPDAAAVASLRRAPTSMLLAHVGLQDDEQGGDTTPASAPATSLFDRFGGLPDHPTTPHDAGEDDSASPAGQSLFALFNAPTPT